MNFYQTLFQIERVVEMLERLKKMMFVIKKVISNIMLLSFIWATSMDIITLKSLLPCIYHQFNIIFV